MPNAADKPDSGPDSAPDEIIKCHGYLPHYDGKKPREHVECDKPATTKIVGWAWRFNIPLTTLCCDDCKKEILHLMDLEDRRPVEVSVLANSD